MPVKKMGSKLAQGVRQVKAQQATAQAVAKETLAPSVVKPTPSVSGDAKAAPLTPAPVNIAKPAATQGARKPAAVKVSLSSTLHPSRVWPD